VVVSWTVVVSEATSFLDFEVLQAARQRQHTKSVDKLTIFFIILLLSLLF